MGAIMEIGTYNKKHATIKIVCDFKFIGASSTTYFICSYFPLL